MIELLRAILGGLFLFLIPGLVWCLLLFGKGKKDILELLALSIALSISVSTLSIFSLNVLLGIKITLMNAGIILFILTIIPVFILVRKSNNIFNLNEMFNPDTSKKRKKSVHNKKIH